LIGYPIVFFSAGRLTDVFFFGLPIYDRVESPTTTVTTCLYSDNNINSTPAVTITSSSLLSLVWDFTDNIATDFNLRDIIHAMVRTTLPSV
jgi:hypothetical protein